MAGGRRCSICDHDQTADITKAIVGGVAYRPLASRYGTTAAALHRHATRCLRHVRKREKPDEPVKSTTAHFSSRFAGARRRHRAAAVDANGTSEESANDVDGSLRFDTAAEARLALVEAKQRGDYKLVPPILALIAKLEEKTVDGDDRGADLNAKLNQLSVDELRALAGQALCARCGAPVAAASDNPQLSYASDAAESEVTS